jgi:predicted Zn-dependent protease
VSIADDPLDPAGLPKASDFEGTPKRRIDLVRDGVVDGVVWDCTSATRAGDGTASTGHAPLLAWRSYGPAPTSLAVSGGEAGSTVELAELVRDGIHVTRLHYLNVVVVDPRQR